MLGKKIERNNGMCDFFRVAGSRGMNFEYNSCYICGVVREEARFSRTQVAVVTQGGTKSTSFYFVENKTESNVIQGECGVDLKCKLIFFFVRQYNVFGHGFDRNCDILIRGKLVRFRLGFFGLTLRRNYVCECINGRLGQCGKI